jgi:RNA polymerase sigma factor (sigma-70 family)
VEDDELLSRWRGGDVEAGETLFARHFPATRRFFRNKVAAQDIEELVQRTFEGLVKSPGEVRGDATFRGFLFTIARFQLYKFLRDNGRRDAQRDHDIGMSSIHDLGFSPSAMVAGEHAQSLVQQALQRVCVDHQVVLELFYWENLTGPEIASALGVAAATVRTRLHRARHAVAEALHAMLVQRGGDAASIEIEQILVELRDAL